MVSKKFIYNIQIYFLFCINYTFCFVLMHFLLALGAKCLRSGTESVLLKKNINKFFSNFELFVGFIHFESFKLYKGYIL